MSASAYSVLDQRKMLVSWWTKTVLPTTTLKLHFITCFSHIQWYALSFIGGVEMSGGQRYWFKNLKQMTYQRSRMRFIMYFFLNHSMVPHAREWHYTRRRAWVGKKVHFFNGLDSRKHKRAALNQDSQVTVLLLNSQWFSNSVTRNHLEGLLGSTPSFW